MTQPSRPLIGLLVATLAFFALWVVALKPSSSASNAGGTSLSGLQSAIGKAHGAVATSNAASSAHGGTIASPPSSATAAGTVTPPTPAGAAATTPTAGTAARAPRPLVTAGSRIAPATRHRLDVVSRALTANKVVAILFFNPAAADDRAVKQELAAVPAAKGGVVKLAIPLNELGRYPVVTTQVPVVSSPTLVLVDSDQQASTIVGFADRFEIAQRVAAALAVR